MRILVIGALGTIGSKLVPALLEAGHELAISSRDPKNLALGQSIAASVILSIC